VVSLSHFKTSERRKGIPWLEILTAIKNPKHLRAFEALGWNWNAIHEQEAGRVVQVQVSILSKSV